MSNPEWWERAVSGTCIHGGHGWDGDTCSDAPATQAAAGHVVDPDPEQSAYDVCAKCGKPIQADYLTGALVTIVGRNAECYRR